MSSDKDDSVLKAPKRSSKKTTKTIKVDHEFETLPSVVERPEESNAKREQHLDIQLELFKTIDPNRPEEEQRYSNTVDLYDSLPKYEWDPSGNETPERILRYREINGEKYQVIV